MDELKQELLQRGLVGSVGDAWAAGLIDGEGSIICTAYMRKRSATDAGNFTIATAILVSQSSTKVLQLLGAHFDAGYVSAPREPKGISKLVSYQWRAKGFGHTEDILRRVSPFLVVKQDRAVDLLLALEAAKAIPKTVRTGTACMSKRRNQGTRQVAHALLPWLEKYQPNGKTHALCLLHASETVDIGKKLTNAEVQHVIQMRENGVSVRSIAALFGISAGYVYSLSNQ